MTSTKNDTGKVKFDLITPKFLTALGRVLTIGDRKYPKSTRDWRFCDTPSDYFAAAMRHMVAWQAGENVDRETGENHLIHAACCMMIIFELWLRGVDDREEKGTTAPPMSVDFDALGLQEYQEDDPHKDQITMDLDVEPYRVFPNAEYSREHYLALMRAGNEERHWAPEAATSEADRRARLDAQKAENERIAELYDRMSRN